MNKVFNAIYRNIMVWIQKKLINENQIEIIQNAWIYLIARI